MPEIPGRYVRVKSLTFYNRSIHVHVNTESGEFVVYDDEGNRLKSGTDWEQTIWKARGMLRRTLANVAIPFRTKNGKTGIALNIHGGTDNVTIRLDGERKQQIDPYEARHYLKPDTTDEQIAEIARLQTVLNETRTKLSNLQAEIEIDLVAAVKAAVDAQIKAADEASWGQQPIPVGANDPELDDDSEGDAFF
jgi:hypothetical protein